MGIATGILCSIPFGKFLSLDIILLSFLMMATYDAAGHAPPKQQVYDYSVTKHYFTQDIYAGLFMWKARLWYINTSGFNRGLAWLSHCIEKIAELCQHQQCISPRAS